MEPFMIKVPATSANLGLGFDSIGVAVDRFLTIKAEVANEWSFDFKDEELKGLPSDKSNLVAQTAVQVAQKYNQKMPALKVIMSSEIPLSHGLGSSSSAIVAGIELANHFLDLNLSDFDKVLLGTEIEGHPDNVGPCVTGDVFVGYYDNKTLYYETIKLEGISLIVSVPAYEISTNEARKALPDSYSRYDAVAQNATSNVMLIAMMKKDYKVMGELMMQDRLHEPYRQPLIKEFDDVKQTALKYGAYATVISGAGPTIMTFCPKDKEENILQALGQLEGLTHQSVNVFSFKK